MTINGQDFTGAEDAAAQTDRRAHLRLVSRTEAGITTAEYCVGTAAGAGLAGVLYQIVTGGFGERMLRTLFAHVMGLLGIG